MKKSLLFVSAAAVSLLASAQTAPQPQVVEGQVVARISPNGEWISNQNFMFGVITVTNLVTGESYEYLPTSAGDGPGIEPFADSELDDDTVPAVEAKHYDAGLGNNLSNTGIVLGTSDKSFSVAGYGEKGVWYDLPISEENTHGMCSSNGITPDGKVICGQVGSMELGDYDDVIMVTPVVWYRNEDGTYGEYVKLPHPTKDFLGLTPQYVTAVCISDDGKTIAGQVQSWSGMYTEPIIYTQDADGKWTYTLVNNQQLFHPNNVEYPTRPTGEPVLPKAQDYATAEEIAAYDAAVEQCNNYMMSRPKQEDYMTEAEIAAYEAAFNSWLNEETDVYPTLEQFMTQEEIDKYNAELKEWTDNSPKYPEIKDFMTDEKRAEYEAALEAYNTAAEEYYAKLAEYNDTIDVLTAGLPHFIFNTVALSGNGRFLGLSNQTLISTSELEEEEKSIPYVFDLEAGTYTKLDANQDLDLLVTYIANDGQVLAASPTYTTTRNAYICKDYAAENASFLPLQDFVKEKNKDLYNWMEENMIHTYESNVFNPDTWEQTTVEHVDAWLTGTPYGTPDMKYIVSWEDNLWDYDKMDLGVYSFSYLLPMDYVNGQASIAASELGIKSARGGKIAFNGSVKSVVVYDINGREVYSCDAPGAEVSTGLCHGLFLIKATDAAGRTATAKAAF